MSSSDRVRYVLLIAFIPFLDNTIIPHIILNIYSSYLIYAILDNTPIIRGINGTELVDLVLKYYHDLSDKYKKMIPLKMVYIPVAKEE